MTLVLWVVDVTSYLTMSLGRLVGKLANVSRCNDTTNMGSLCNDTPVIGQSKVVSNKKRVEETTPHQILNLFI
jgi:hypothetical protein